MSEPRDPNLPDPSSHGGHPYTPTERAMGYGTDHDPRFVRQPASEHVLDDGLGDDMRYGRQPASEPASEPDIEAIRRRWHTYHDRGAHDYTDEGCRILAEHAFRDVNALLAALAAARGDIQP